MTPLHTRRQLLRSALAVTAGLSLAARQAAAQTLPTDDYKALVCIYLAGGNDGHNLVVPLEPQANAEYRRLRGALALPDGSANLVPVATASGARYGLNSGLTAIAPLWASRRLAVMANLGPLAAPTTRAQILAGTATLPSNLYSHSDQAQIAQAGNANGGGGTGWGARCVDAVLAKNGSARFPAALSMSGNALYTTGAQVASASLLPDFDLGMDGMNVWPASAAQARATALAQILTLDGGVRLIQAANTVRRDAMALNTLLRSTSAGVVNTAFPGTTLGRQLRQVARVLALRGSTGLQRQVFFCQLGGFDTHSNQGWTHWDLLRQLGEAMAAFDAATVELGLAARVTTFTQSEFGRTLQPSGNGSDHGWGNHQLLMGGAVRGGEVWGRFPFPALAGPDDAGNRGALIPGTSLEQFGATLARWLGADAAALAAAFPNLAAFSPQDLGFMLPG
jgi:uncharacterized protein (DUF1501 family)